MDKNDTEIQQAILALSEADYRIGLGKLRDLQIYRRFRLTENWIS